MLEQMRHRGASIFIYLIFGLLVAIFVVTPLSGNQEIGCKSGSSVVVHVDGNQVNESAFKVAFSNPFNPYQARQKVYFALDTVIQRELLAAEAKARGIRTNEEMVQQELMKGFFFVGGQRRDLGQLIFDIDEDGERTWRTQKFRGLVQSMDVSKNAFIDEQKRGLQAALMTELLAGSAQVSRDEALKDYLYTNNTVSYDVVTFSPALYRAAMLLTEADIERFLAAHEDQVKARYKEKEREYLDRKPELKLRQIFIAKAEPAAKPEDKQPDDAKPGDAKPADAKKPAAPKAADAKKPADPKKPAAPKAADAKKAEQDVAAAGDAAKAAGMPIEEAKAKLEAARATIGSDKQKFIELAKQLNTDPVLRASGGDVGWRTAENVSLGEKVVSDAVKTLKPGELTPVITTERGAYLVLVEGTREKNLTYDQVKHEIAAELAREVWSKEAAKRDALKALEAATASGKPLGDLYLREIKPGFDFREIQRQINDPNTDPAIRQLLQQQLQRQLQLQLGGDQHGSIVIESPDVPAAWKAGDAAPAGGAAPAPAPAGSAAPAPAAGATPTPTPTPAAGAAPTPAAGTPPAAPAPAAAKPAPLVPSSDVLPAFHNLAEPKVRKEGPHPRQKRLPGVDADGVRVLFDELEKGKLAPRVFEADGNYTIVQLVDKTDADVKEFDKIAARHIDRLREARGAQLVRDWLVARCDELEKGNRIKVRADKTAEFDDKGKPAPTVYRPCMTLR